MSEPSPVERALAEMVKGVGLAVVLASLSAVAQGEVERVLQEQRDRVAAGRYHTVSNDLRAMSKVVDGQI